MDLIVQEGEKPEKGKTEIVQIDVLENKEEE